MGLLSNLFGGGSGKTTQSTSTRLPSWMASRDKIGEFILGAERLAEQHGVPILDSAMMLSIEQFRNEALHHAGAMEAQGASFAEQQKVLAEKLIELHNKT